MKKDGFSTAGRIVTLLLPLLVIVGGLMFSFLSGGQVGDNRAKYQDYPMTDAGDGGRNSYAAYRSRFPAGAAAGGGDLSLDVFAYTAGEGLSAVYNLAGEEKALRMEEDGFAEYAVTAEGAGFYNLYVEYYPVESRGIPLERSLTINGEQPFEGAGRLVFPRIYTDAGPPRRDSRGNELRPSQVEAPRWEGLRARDADGYVREPYVFYLGAGENVVRLTGVTEPWAVRKLVLAAPSMAQSYGDYAAGIDAERFRNGDMGFSLKIQGESAQYRSDPSLYAVYDRSSGQTEPASTARIILNMAGGTAWKTPGQWIEWEFEVPEDGMYRLSFKARQNQARGYAAGRMVMIDGAVPCAELAAVAFRYENAWRLHTLTDGAGEAMLFPLSRGKHAVRLQVTLGDLGPLLETMENAVFRLNAVYRKILILTGPSPDAFRDYRIEVIYPDVVRNMETESRVLYKLVDDLTAYVGGERSAQAAQALTLARQLEMFADRPDRIPAAMGDFKSAISSLGDSIMALSASPLDIDYLVVSAPAAELPVVRGNFFVDAAHEAASFLASFVNDYTTLGDGSRSVEAVQVWVGTGRDQGSIIKAMVDDSFTSVSGIPVNVKLVDMGILMPAVVAGIGPDVVLSAGGAEPVNFAMRHAAQDLSGFPGFAEVVKRFRPSALEAFKFGGGVYALPETQSFQVMFYRKDILEELQLEVPETWAQLIALLPVIQNNNMNVGIPSNASAGGMDMSGFLTQLYQRGGALYNGEGSRTALAGETAIRAFDAYTQFFTHYQLPVSYDFTNRFRSGEMPIGFADFSTFNTLYVFAPEIRGLWGFALLPGTLQPDGTLDRTVPAGATATMMFPSSKRKEGAWEFMVWWTGAEAQLRFGREMESVMGASARYASANTAAFERTAWRAADLAVLREQGSWTRGTPEVPGGYYVSRYVANAVRKVLNAGADTRETLLRSNRLINDELIKKRIEFGLEGAGE